MHYVCSDIHGHYDYFMDILNKINFSKDDHMYIVGDVVDRGPEPIKLLKYILNQDNMTLLIGNHEHFMIQTLLFGNDDIYNLWMYNGGDKTIEAYNELEEDEQRKLLIELFKCPLIVPNLKVGNTNFYLAHACHTMRDVKDIVKYCDSSKGEIEMVVWSREYKNPDTQILSERFKDLYSKYENTKLIIGHTPVFLCSYGVIDKKGRPLISRSCSGHLINLDCGCSRGLPLSCLRLEDMKEFYADLPDGMKIVMK